MKKSLILILGLFLIGFVFAGEPQKFEGFDSENENTWGNIGTNYLSAMTFTVGTTGPNENFTLTSLKLKLYKAGYVGEVRVSIRRADDSFGPIGRDLSIGKLNGENITSSSEWYEVPMTNYELKSSTKYAIVIYTISSDYLTLKWSQSNIDHYSNGDYFWQWVGESWQKVDQDDCLFEVWGIIGENLTSQLTLDERISVLELWSDLLENWKNEIENRFFWIDERFFGLEEMFFNEIDNLHSRITELENNSNSESKNYFKYLSTDQRKNIVCEYAKANNLTQYADLGWDCTITLRISSWAPPTKVCSCKIIPIN